MDDSHDRVVRKSRRVSAAASLRPNGTSGKKNRGGLKRKHGSIVQIDFNKWEMPTLKKYREHFNLEAPPKSTKSQLVTVVKKHFIHTPKLRESEVVADFLYANNKAKQKHAQRHTLHH